MNDITIEKEELRRLAGLFNIEETAAIIGIEPRSLRYDLERGLVVRPAVQIGTKPRRYYRTEDVKRIRDALARKTN